MAKENLVYTIFTVCQSTNFPDVTPITDKNCKKFAQELIAECIEYTSI